MSTDSEGIDMRLKSTDKIMEEIVEAEIVNEEAKSVPLKPLPTRTLSPDEQEAATKPPPQINVTISPPKRCPSCKLKTSSMKTHGYPDGMLMFPIPNMGIAHFTCPRCFAVMMNRECFETQRRLRKQAQSRIATPNRTITRQDMQKSPLKIIK